MKQIQHFILGEDIGGNSIRIQDKDILHQMKDVLRFKIGSECVVLDGKGARAKGVIEEFNKKFATIVLSDHETCNPQKHIIRLYCCLSKKPSTFELIVQKATELGVTEIIPLISDRTQIDRLQKPERLLNIIREATEQSERCFLPILAPLTSVDELVKNPPKGRLLVGDPWKSESRLCDIDLSKTDAVNIVIGPEGGLSDKEIHELRSAGGTIFLLGETILRMETAVISSIAVVQFSLLC